MTNNNQQDYRDYLDRKHAGMLTPPEMVEEYVKKATGFGVAKQERLMLGEANEVYNITITNGEEIIVRISHSEYEAFGKEKWAIEACQKVGVPVPEVLLVEDIKTDGKFRSICILEKLRGEPLMQKVKEENISEIEIEKILKEVGKILSRIHTVKTQKFGWINENGVGYQNTWAEYVLKRTKSKEVTRVKEVARKINLDPEYIDKAAEILKRHQNIYSQIEPRLLHGDLSYEHIFIEGEKITGIIDWGNATSGDPVHDFAWWNFFNNDESTAHLIEGYENKKLFKSDFELRLNLCILYLSLDFLNYYDEGNYKPGLEIAKKGLLKGLNYFSS